MENEEDDNWLNLKEIKCPNCKVELSICDHSPFENSYRLNCDSCPTRVDISTYDNVFDKFGNTEDIEYETLLLKLESLLSNCACGGKFKLNSKRRCLFCQSTLEIGEEQNVWPSNKLEEEEAEKILNKFIVEPKWKK